MNFDVIGRTGHMEKGDHVSDEVIVRVVDGDDYAIGRGATEKEAASAAKAELERFRAEQATLNTPEVKAARAAYGEALRQAMAL